MTVEPRDAFQAASRRDLLALRPDLADEHGRLLDAIWDRGDPVVLEL